MVLRVMHLVMIHKTTLVIGKRLLMMLMGVDIFHDKTSSMHDS